MELKGNAFYGIPVLLGCISGVQISHFIMAIYSAPPFQNLSIFDLKVKAVQKWIALTLKTLELCVTAVLV